VKQLTDNEYLFSLPIPVTRGKSPLVYTLARKGLNYLKEHGFDVREYFRPSKEQEKSYLFLQHTLAINDVLIAASNLHNVAPDYSLRAFIHERVLKKTPYKISFMRGGET
jgi:Replication-relaxation